MRTAGPSRSGLKRNEEQRSNHSEGEQRGLDRVREVHVTNIDSMFTSTNPPQRTYSQRIGGATPSNHVSPYIQGVNARRTHRMIFHFRTMLPKGHAFWVGGLLGLLFGVSADSSAQTLGTLARSPISFTPSASPLSRHGRGWNRVGRIRFFSKLFPPAAAPLTSSRTFRNPGGSSWKTSPGTAGTFTGWGRIDPNY